MNHLIFVVGGARSGKSRFAQQLAAGLGGEVVYIATAEARDDEMKERIAAHRRARPESWRTVEAPLELAEALHSCRGKAEVILVDCLTVFISNLLMKTTGFLGERDNPEIDRALTGQVEAEISEVIKAATESAAHVIVVSNEVGQGLVPPYKLGRFYRDMVGWANQRLAAAADKVYLVHCGLALELKAAAVTAEQACEELRKEEVFCRPGP